MIIMMKGAADIFLPILDKPSTLIMEDTIPLIIDKPCILIMEGTIHLIIDKPYILVIVLDTLHPILVKRRKGEQGRLSWRTAATLKLMNVGKVNVYKVGFNEILRIPGGMVLSCKSGRSVE